MDRIFLWCFWRNFIVFTRNTLKTGFGTSLDSNQVSPLTTARLFLTADCKVILLSEMLFCCTLFSALFPRRIQLSSFDKKFRNVSRLGNLKVFQPPLPWNSVHCLLSSGFLKSASGRHYPLYLVSPCRSMLGVVWLPSRTCSHPRHTNELVVLCH